MRIFVRIKKSCQWGQALLLCSFIVDYIGDKEGSEVGQSMNLKKVK
jgi:hypothetical protein